MYSAIWRHLPGPRWFRAFTLLVIVGALVLACFEWFFPWLTTKLPLNEPALESDGTGTTSVQVTAPADPTDPGAITGDPGGAITGDPAGTTPGEAPTDITLDLPTDAPAATVEEIPVEPIAPIAP
jgi:hypothetical protein